jgi:hypothetical protein
MTDSSEKATLASKDVVIDWMRDCSLLIESGVATSYIEVCPIRLHGLLAELQQLRARPSHEAGELFNFVEDLSHQHCSHGGDKNAPVWPCTPCAARTVLRQARTLKASEGQS